VLNARLLERQTLAPRVLERRIAAGRPVYALSPESDQARGVRIDPVTVQHGFIVLPDDILDYMSKVNDAMTAMDVDVQKQAAGTDFATGWTRFLGGWRKFWDDHQSYWSRWQGSVWDETEIWERDLSKWRDMFTNVGGRPTTPRPTDDRPDPLGSALKTGAVVGALGLVAWLFWETHGR
jgi:hypothetical protein